MPLTLSYQPLNPGKQRRFMCLNPLVQEGFVMIEHKSLERIAESGGGTEGGECFSETFFPAPKPDRVEVRIADQDQLSSGVHDRAFLFSR
jgi:hypothetical protein